MNQTLTTRASRERQSAADAFRDFIAAPEFPCVAAKSARALGQIEILEAGSLGSPEWDRIMHRAIVRFGRRLPQDRPAMHSFAVIFKPAPGPKSGPEPGPESGIDEAVFTARLWRRLQALHDIDVEQGFVWDSSVSSDPASAHFSLSLGGVAYFVVGLHPQASRLARRFSQPVLVFNPHRQFEQLKADGRYPRIRDVIRERDARQQGGINPMLADFGDRSEALQYSGARLSGDWTCPMKVRR